MTLVPAPAGGDHPPVHAWRRRGVGSSVAQGPARCTPAVEDPLLSLQRMAGNAAVSHLVAETAVPETQPMLRVGSVGDAVRQAQDLHVGHGATISVDGQFGQLTQRAVVEFQRSAGLSPDGVVGPRTWSALEAG
jgi:peptidoglycan hydrolase-like protein with peptidoglycan-binding domain